MFKEEIYDIYNELDNINARIDSLCNAVNTNIASLQTIIDVMQDNDYVDSITPIVEGGETVGYEIVFTQSGSVKIYHGKKGETGHTPIVGVQQAEDGRWYWTIDGEWLLDGEGDKVLAEAIDGIDGEKGEEGITPKLEVRDNYWYISYDNGATWVQLGKATGENGKDGDSMFKSISYNEDYVELVLADGKTVIKIPTWASHMLLVDEIAKINSNISAIQAAIEALESNDYVQKVTPVKDEEGNVIGYTLQFAFTGDVTIFHGEDGKDGEDGEDGKDGADGEDGKDGKDGYTPVIGARQHPDGNWYWTVDTEWLLDTNGNKVKTTGEDGTSGITPELKIEDDYWYVSYDKGQTWTKLGKAKGEDGADGEGKDGDSFFKDVNVTEDYVTFTLANGTEIKIPTWKVYQELADAVAHLNTNVQSMQTIIAAIQNNDFVTGTTEIVDHQTNEVIGYKLHFSKSGDIEIYHGKTPNAPKIGIKKHPQYGNCWAYNDQYIYDEAGKPVALPQDGSDAIAPKFKIEGGRWWMSTDGGDSWDDIGQATGDQGEQGEQGDTGELGDSFFKSVKEEKVKDANGNYVVAYIVMTLADGSEYRVPTAYITDELTKRIAAIEGQFTVISTIVNALQNAEYIKEVVELYDGPTLVGYEITFVKYTIGTDGKLTETTRKSTIRNGGAGAAGTVVAAQYDEATDTWYWTLDGQPLKDKDGNYVAINGRPGQAGVTPKMQINKDTNEWEVSYDNGTTWTSTGVKATGPQGPQGNPGQGGAAGDSFFAGVSKDGDYWVFELVSGEKIMVPTAEAFASLAGRVAALEKSAESILSLVNGKKYIESCEPFSNDSGSGYHLVLVSLNAETGEATKEDCYIYNGIAGNTPVVGLRQDEATGDWYWTVDGEDLLVDGKPVKANGPEPSFHIDQNGHLWVNVNGNEKDLGNVIGAGGGSGADASILVEEVKDDAGKPTGELIITFMSGTSETGKISVPSWAVFVTVRDAVLNLNETVEALSDFVEGKSYITNIEECTKTDENGVTKTGFRISYVIYTDGQASEVQTKEIYNGIDGTNGHTPEMGLRQDEATGDWYWTVDGEDLLVNGKPVKANGADGVNAPVPSFEINVLGELVVTIGDETINLGKVVGTNGTAGTNSSIKVTEGEDGMIKIEFIVGENITNTIYVPSWDEFVKVRDAVADLNETVEALSDFVEGKSYITNIEECTKTDENGVTKTGFKISYVVYTDGKASEEQTKEIYNGIDGTNGHTPEMGLRPGNPDNNESADDWYWTVDGEDLLINNKPVKANGADGKDAPVPSFDINDDGELVVTIGEEVINLGKVVGTNGTAGTNSSIKVTEGEDGMIKIEFIVGENITNTIYVPSWDEFVKVRDAVADLNETVEALSDFVEGKSYITNIEECTKTDENGVTKTGFKISYVVYTDGKASEEQTKEIYNGIDGTNGHTPEMGLRPGNPDNNESADDWYWTVDGEDLLINNKPVKANGADGKDAPVPSFDINDDGELVVTIGKEDINLGKVVGTDGTDGTNSSIVVTEEEVDGVKTGKITIQFVTGEETTATIVVPSWDEFVKVRALVDDLNKRVEDLEILLGDKTFITDIDPSWKETIDNVERTGTKITYIEIINGTPSEPKFMYIYNGLAGANGADGVTVGVKTWTAEDGEEGEVGKLYWTITQNNQTDWLRNGENLVPATGPQGKDGYSPKFKIVEGTLYYSYDKDNVSDEETEGWTVIGKVTGENGTDAVVEIDDKNANYYVIKYKIGDSVEEITVPKWVDASEVSVTFNPTTLNLGTDDEGTVTCTIEGSFTSAPEITVSCEGLYVSEIQGTPTTNADGAYQYTIKVTKTVSYAGATMSGKLTVMVPYYGTSIVKQLPITATSPSLEVQNINAGKTSLTYSIGNISDDKKKIKFIFEPEIDKLSWVTGISYDENDNPVVNLLANTTTEARECTITALLPNGRILDKRTINQLGYDEKDDNASGDAITNLADIESANCYIISAGGTYMLPTVKGNTTTQIDGIAGVPELIWSDDANGFEFVSATNDHIVFRVGATSLGILDLSYINNGNMVVGVKNEAGEVLWSWHLWFTTSRPGTQTYPHATLGEGTAGEVVMDRALGASLLSGGNGLYYQWGRKDPFRVINNSISNLSENGTYDNATRNPAIFYTKWSSEEGRGWKGKEETQKTINDPCPPGYKVPASNVWMDNAPNKDNSTSARFTYSTTYASTTDEIYYPYTSYIENGSLIIKDKTPITQNGSTTLYSREVSLGSYTIRLKYSGTTSTSLGMLWGTDKSIYYDSQTFQIDDSYTIEYKSGSSWKPLSSTLTAILNRLGLNKIVTGILGEAKAGVNNFYKVDITENNINNGLQVRCVKKYVKM